MRYYVPNICLLLILLLLPMGWASGDPAPPETEDSPSVTATEPLIIRAVIPTDAPPTSFRNKATGKAEGFAVDALELIAGRLQFQIKYLFVANWEEAIMALQRGDADLCPDLAITPERTKLFSFTSPLEVLHLRYFARSTGNIREFDLSSARIGATKGSATSEILKSRGASLVLYDTYSNGFYELLAGKIDFFAGPAPTIDKLLQDAELTDRIEPVLAPFAEIKRCMAVKKDNQELLAKLAPEVDSFLAAPDYQKLYHKWYGHPRAFWSPQRISTAMLITLSVILVIMGIWRYVSVTGLNRELENIIAEKQKVEGALRTSEERLRMAMQASNQGLYDLNIQTGEAIVNDQYATMLGYDPAEFHETNADWIARLHPEDYERTASCYRDYIAGTTSTYQVEFRQKTKDGNWKWILSLGKIVEWDAAGNPLRMLGTHTDITDRKRIEEATRTLNEELEKRVSARTAELESALKHQESFAYSISHDLRAPLRAVDGYAKIISEEFAGQFPARARDYLNRMSMNVIRMGRLIDDLLQFSRLALQPLEKQSTNVTSLVADVLRSISCDPPDKPLPVTIGHLPECQADPDLLKQVYANLIGNALKYTTKQDQPLVEIGSTDCDGMTVYFVRDNGVGFDMAYADKLFGVFQRLHGMEEFEGTGVGLAIAHNIITRHGGRIWAESEQGKGATFYFTVG